MDFEKFKDLNNSLPVGLSEDLKNGAECVNAQALKNQKEWLEKDRDLKVQIQSERKAKRDQLARELFVAAMSGQIDTLSTPKIEAIIYQSQYAADTFIKLVYDK